MATIERHVTRGLVVLDGATPCREAARIMSDRNIGSVAVVEQGRVVGLVGERELVRRVIAEDGSPSRPLREALGERLPTVTPRTTELECLALMRDHGTRHLLVTDGDTVAGVISMRDLIRLMLEEKEWLIGQLQTFIQGHGAPRATAL